MPERAWFIPGRASAPDGPLARYRPTQPVEAIAAYVQTLTQPGGLVVDLFCQGPVVVRETVAAGRRALGLSVNPLLLVVARMGLDKRNSDALNAAFTHLADSPKGDIPLHRHLTSLYRSACPTCEESGIAVWLAWERDGHYPFRKAVLCPRCEGVQEGDPDDVDVDLSQRIQPRGLAYYYALDRVAPPGHSARERAAELVELYTPRNLSALMDLAMRLQDLEIGQDARLVMTSVLLDCLDRCSSLAPYDEERSRPRTLRIPSLYLERNVWLYFEETFSHTVAEAAPTPLNRAKNVAALASGEEDGYVLISHAARDLRDVVQPGSAALIITDPPRPDAVFWALSALWAGWLWESPSARRLRPFLQRRRFDWDWHWRVLRAALNAAGPLLTPDGHLLTLFSHPDETLLESVCLAACGAGYTLEGWGYSPEAGYRLVWRWQNETPTAPEDAEKDAERLGQNLASTAKEAIVGALEKRSEPTPWTLLHASAYAGLAERGALAQTATMPKNGSAALTMTAEAVRRAFEAAPIARCTDGEKAGEALWWLVDSARITDSLADQVETLVWELLLKEPACDLDTLVDAVYSHLDGALTPELGLVLTCIDSYSAQDTAMPRLRLEDDPLQRTAEVKALRNGLTELGKRLGFKVKRRGSWDVRWLDGKQEAYVFIVSPTAALTHHLLARRTVDEGAQRCLVFPGGRAQLVTFKLQRDPRLSSAVKADGWQFIKFRHLRHLMAGDELDRHALKTVLGLDPIVEQEAAQIPLF